MKRKRPSRMATFESLEARWVPSSGFSSTRQLVKYLQSGTLNTQTLQAFNSFQSDFATAAQTFLNSSSTTTTTTTTSPATTFSNFIQTRVAQLEQQEAQVVAKVPGASSLVSLIDYRIAGTNNSLSLLAQLSSLASTNAGTLGTPPGGTTTTTPTGGAGSPISGLFNQFANLAILTTRQEVINDFNVYARALARFGTNGAKSWFASLSRAIIAAGESQGTGTSTGTGTGTGTSTGTGTGTTTGTTTVTGGNTVGAYTITPAGEQGPFFDDFTDTSLNRSNVTTDTTTGTAVAGAPLTLTLHLYSVSSAGVATPLTGVRVDIWEANPSGLYSAEASQGTTNQNYLRGYQTPDSSGTVTFQTIIPGWYSGRTPHIHIMIRNASSLANVLTTQLMFPQTFINSFYTSVAPYSTRGLPDTTDAQDRVYSATDAAGTAAGPLLSITPTPNGSGGYTVTYNIYVQSS